jgi:hypothetical protein
LADGLPDGVTEELLRAMLDSETSPDGSAVPPGPGDQQPSWDAPEPLECEGELEPYPLDALPKELRAAVEEVVAFVQCPPALAACSALAQLSVSGQGCANVYRNGHGMAVRRDYVVRGRRGLWRPLHAGRERDAMLEPAE